MKKLLIHTYIGCRLAVFLSTLAPSGVIAQDGPGDIPGANWIDWRYGRPGVNVVTNAPSRDEVVEIVGGSSLGPRIEAIEGRTNEWDAAYGWGNHAGAGYATTGALDTTIQNLATHTNDTAIHLTAEQAQKIEAAITSAPPQSVTSVNAMTGAVVITAQGLGALTAETDPVAIPLLAAHTNDAAIHLTSEQAQKIEASITTIPPETDPVAIPLLAAHTNDTAIHLTPEQAERIAAAVTNEQDLAALRTYHYGSPDIIESPVEWFSFDASTGTITGFNWETGREHVVIPWQIGGVQVVKLDGLMTGDGNEVVSVIAPKSVVEIYTSMWDCDSLAGVSLPNTTTVNSSLQGCNSLAGVSLPNATTVNYSLLWCDSLAGVSLPNTTTVNSSLQGCDSLASVTFSGSPPAFNAYTFRESPNVTVYVDNPTATGWGSTFGGRPVVRLPVTASAVTANESITLAGQTITEWPESGDPNAVPNLNGTATNLATSGWMQLPQTETGTNVTVRLWTSNNVIIAEEVYK